MTVLGNVKIIGVSIMLVMLMLHFYIYEVKNQHEYFYYYNLGLSRFQLWLSTFLLGFINAIIFAII